MGAASDRELDAARAEALRLKLRSRELIEQAKQLAGAVREARERSERLIEECGRITGRPPSARRRP
jgi:hypothetical protein